MDLRHALRTFIDDAEAQRIPSSQFLAEAKSMLGSMMDFGLPVTQEPKYSTCPVSGRIWNRATGIAIPDDEPIMIFRAKDARARRAIQCYVDTVIEQGDRGHHKNVCFERYQQFVTFAEQHLERMHEPDTALCSR